MIESIILHADVNNFYASVECVNRPELFDKPVAVAGNPEKRTGVILAKNEVAKKYGIKTGQSIFEAKQLCKDLICLQPHLPLYQKISKQIHKIYLEYTDLVEPMGLDECWLDVTSSSKVLKKSGKQIADELRQKIKEQFNITISVGVSFSKIFAKLGSDMKKPDATTIIPYEKFKEMTYNLPLNSIVGIGRRLEKKFTSMNILTIGDFVQLDDEFLKKITNITGVELKHQLLGTLCPKIKSYYEIEPPKSVGNGTTTTKDIVTRAEVEKVVRFLTEKISNRLITGNFVAETLSVSLKTNEFKWFHHSKKISATNSSSDLAKDTIALIDTFWQYDLPLRAIRICTSSLTNITEAKQLSFFGEKKENLSKTVNSLLQKYGEKAIYNASETPNFINKHTFDEEE